MKLLLIKFLTFLVDSIKKNDDNEYIVDHYKMVAALNMAETILGDNDYKLVITIGGRCEYPTIEIINPSGKVISKDPVKYNYIQKAIPKIITKFVSMKIKDSDHNL